MTMEEASPSVHSHASQAPTEAIIGTESLNQFLHMPEEIILDILSHLERPDLLALSCASRTMNRLGIQHLLSSSFISKPTAYSKLVLDPSPQATIDPLMVLLHSVHIKEIEDLSFYFTRFHSYSTLAQPLRRSLHLLRSLSSAGEVTLFFGPKGEKEPKDEKYFKEMIAIFEDLFNEMIVKSCKKIRVFGAQGLLAQFYEFRGLTGTGSSPSSSKFLASVKFKDYLDRRQDRNSEDPIIVDDLRYSRTTLTGSRIFTRCSPQALSGTQLSHLNFGTSDFLRPPFSQWMYTMLKASNILSLSFAFSHLPSDPEEVEFVLRRLSSVLPRLNRLYLFDIKPEVLPILMKWINMFPSLRTLQIEPFTDISNENFSQLESQPPSLFTGTTAGPFTFAPSLRRIDAPHQFLAYFFTAYEPNPEVEEVADPDNIRFPALEMVHLDYFCIKRVGLDLGILTGALKRIKPLATRPNSPSAIVVHLKFDKSFLGLLPSICEGRMPQTLEPDDIAVLALVEKVRLGLPGSREEIIEGKFDDKILGCVTIFSGLRYLRLASTEHLTKSKEELSTLRLQIFKERNPGLRRIDIL